MKSTRRYCSSNARTSANAIDSGGNTGWWRLFAGGVFGARKASIGAGGGGSNRQPRTWLVVAWLMLLAGCGSGGDSADSNNHGYGFAYDAQGVTGLRLRYTPTLKADAGSMTDPAYYEQWFAEVERCTGLNAPPPFVVWDHLPNGTNGLYYSAPDLVVLDSVDAIRHEFVHYLLDVNTGSPDTDHRSRWFSLCA